MAAFRAGDAIVASRLHGQNKTRLAGDPAGLVHVGGGAAERHRDEVGLQLRGDRDQLAVAFGQRAQRQPATELVQALAVRQLAVVEHAGGDAFAVDRLDLQLHHAVVEQQHVIRRDIAGQAEVADADLGGRALRRVLRSDQVETLAGFQLHLAAGEPLDPDLRPRQVGEDADLAANPQRRLAHRLGTRELGGRVAVREVEADHVDPGRQQCVEHARRVGGGAEGGEDAGAARGHGRGRLLRLPRS